MVLEENWCRSRHALRFDTAYKFSGQILISVYQKTERTWRQRVKTTLHPYAGIYFGIDIWPTLWSNLIFQAWSFPLELECLFLDSYAHHFWGLSPKQCSDDCIKKRVSLKHCITLSMLERNVLIVLDDSVISVHVQRINRTIAAVS